MVYKKGWVPINSVPTMVRTWGGWIDEEIKTKEVLLLITGNPGISDFYMKFLSMLHFILQIPVWIVCHAGHQLPPDDCGLKMPPLKKNTNLYTLQGQVDHKKWFINKYIPKDKNIYLIGHSVGGKVVVELLKDEQINEQITQAHLLFPTLEHFDDTHNAWLLKNVTLRILFILNFVSWLLYKLPYHIRFCLVRTVYFLRLNFSMPTCAIHGIVKLISPQVIKQAIFLAHDEMLRIKDLDHDVYETNKNKIWIYYGQKDGWTEPHHFENMRLHHPEVNAQMLDSKFAHIFTFQTNYEMAEVLCRVIKSNS
ncbi:lipid droplet-associated hydrolase [Cimex lectularius]|uniref:Lipid droplet-associated hydrolase n=1 Tax=Cimex lectularius TaxID=79782 RepID=A0A8I6STX3_CIMLE|nr:lipid droplet-associated hydrolase [Cimex lectularius]XP_024085638.1 lipid droplet-associated hydrolase [Cimex lectularius]